MCVEVFLFYIFQFSGYGCDFCVLNPSFLQAYDVDDNIVSTNVNNQRRYRIRVVLPYVSDLPAFVNVANIGVYQKSIS